MDEYTMLNDVFLADGMLEETASRLAELINDVGASRIRDILKSLELY